MKAIINNVNIRGREVKENKKGEEYVVVRLEDESGKAYELIDKDIERADYYKRGVDMDLTVDITMGKFTNLRIIDAKLRQ